MSEKNNVYILSLALLGIAAWGTSLFGQEGVWMSAGRPPLTAGAAALGQPVPLGSAPAVKSGYSPIILTQGEAPPPAPPGAFVPNGSVPAPPPAFGSPAPPPTFGAPPPFIPGSTGMPLDQPAPSNTGFLDNFRNYIGNGPFAGSHHRKPFESDHAFDNFASPTTNIFLFEDPRALTEVRPLYIFQTIPGANQTLQGGNVNYLGMQARVAITERISMVFNKFGWISLNPTDKEDGFNSALSFSEIWLGPKWTFLRDEQHNLVAAAGLIFEIPAGPQRAFQNTGSLSLTPYASVAYNFGRSSFGSFDVMSNLNWNISTSSARSNFLNLSAQLDYDVLNWHRFYPMFNFNWNIYTKGGQSDFHFDGVDLVNFGGTSIGGKSVLTLGPGFRYKWTEGIQTGIGMDWAVVGNQFLQDFRLTIDTIFRY